MKKIILTLLNIICYFSFFSQNAGTYIDTRNGKVYKTIKIGKQTWFAENLAYKTFSGCWAYNNSSSNVAKYGYLYNWETAKTACPTGWHLPSDVEWTTLTNYLGGEILAGGKLKSRTNWQYDAGGNATDESGFSALPAGARNYDGSFKFLGAYASFWSSTPGSSDRAWHRSLEYNYGKVGRYYGSRTNGDSIRCTKD